ncbi:MAG: hypothetical protein GY835_11085 [bacterium]|nr:hypothetical protein [bacterium]
MGFSIQDIRPQLAKFTRDNMSETLPLLAELLTRHHKARTAVDVERARYITAYMKKPDSRDEPIQIKRAKAVKNYLSNRKVHFHDDNRLGGATTAHELGAPVYPEFFGLGIWPELEFISERKANPQFLSTQDAKTLNYDVFPWWLERTISEQVRKKDSESQALVEKMILMTISKAATISHTTPDYGRVVKQGINKIIANSREQEAACGSDTTKINFYKSIRISMQGILDYSANIAVQAQKRADEISDSAPQHINRRSNLLEIARICSKVPAEPAASYHEAVTALWICQVAVMAENSNMAINPGRIDQILYPFFRNDIESGRLTVAEALEITGCLWLKLADNVNLVPEAAERLFGGAGAVPAITLGGIDADGRDAVNELTYLMLKVTELLPIRDPNVNARYLSGTNPVEYRDEVSRVILSTKAIPAFFNDEQNIRALEEQAETLEHARDYAVVGCVELGSAGRDYSASSSIFMMLHTVLYMALHNGRTPVTGDKSLGPETGEPADLPDIEAFWSAFEAQYAWLADKAVHLNNLYGKAHQENLPTPLLSSLFHGPMESGRDLIFGGAVYNSSGVTHIGFADVCDSINAIEDVCFSNNRMMHMPLADLVAAVDADFEGYDDLWHYVRNRAPKYGTEHKVAIRNSQRMIRNNFECFDGKRNYRGGNYRVAYWTMTNHAGYGRVAGALPNGRKAKVVFSSGITPASQVDTSLTSALNDVARLDSRHIPGAYALNMKYSSLEGESAATKRFSDVIESYFRSGGQQVQFNIQDYHTLIDAKATPDEYEDLLVRVSGYSAYFNSLNSAMQDELITRSQYDLMGNGKFVKLDPPLKSFKSLSKAGGAK